MSTESQSVREKVGALSSDRARLLNLLLDQKIRRVRPIQPYPRTPSGPHLTAPPSWAQQRLWFIDRLAGGHGGYVIPTMSVRLRGPLDRTALRRALDAMVMRHEVLRTSIVNGTGGPIQEIAAEGQLPLREADLTGYTAEEREAEVRRHQLGETQGQFDIGKGPLIRGRLLRLEPEVHVLLITMHHIITDGWSIRLFSKELAQLYAAFSQGKENPLPPLKIQYADYAQWQKEWLQGEVLENQLRYWRSRLEGAAPYLDLPTDRPRPSVQGYRGANVQFTLDAELTARLKAFARKHDVTLFMTLYAGLSILLSRLSGQTDVIVGTPIANRQRPELENLLGLFVNTLVLRADVQGDATVEDLLKQVKATTLGAYNHQDAPLEKVIEALQVPRSLNRAPLFQVMFVLHNEPRTEMRLPKLEVIPEQEVDESSILDLWMSLEERGGELAGTVNYSADLFERSTIERWMASYRILMDALVREPQSRVWELPILTSAERKRVLEDFNATASRFPRLQLIDALFEQQVARSPRAVAVVEGDTSLTYEELNAAANRLARYLCERGVRTGSYVALHMSRSRSLLVAQIAVLKCGAAYVPIDPQLPVGRRAFLIRDCEARFVLAADPQPDDLRLPAEVEWIDCMAARDAIARQEAKNLEIFRPADSPAFVLYTSGSTGSPKGVIIPHRAIDRLVFDNGYARFGASDCFSNASNPAFDASTFEIWAPLLTGARVVVIPRSVVLDAALFAEALDRHGVTVLFLTTALFNQHALSSPQILARRRYVLFGGEAADVNAVRRVLRESPPEHLLNMYGPTETTTFATCHEVKSVPDEATSIPIGKPIAETRIRILDAHGRPVPIGVTGEIFIGGSGVALGYLNRSELTTERFVGDTFSDLPNAVMYRTGDLARWREDGSIEFLGRRDHQVKLRGFRIEPGEIEARLLQHSQVKEGAVIVREDVPGEKRLVAYFTAASDSLGVEALRDYLQAQLPEYMIPGAFVRLSAMPMTPSGKIDRRSLPAPEMDSFVTRAYEAPQGELEGMLAAVWQDLLRVEKVGRQDNFFELGGHSLLVVKLLEKLRGIGFTAEVRDVFGSPTLEAFARTVQPVVGDTSVALPNLIPPGCTRLTPEMLPLVKLSAEDIERITRAVPGGVTNIEDVYPLTPLQEGLLFHHLMHREDGDPYLRPKLFSFASRKRLQEFVDALQKVIDRHEVLRTAVLWEGLPRVVQVVQRSARMSVEQIALREGCSPEAELEHRMTTQRLDLRVAPLVRLQVAPASETGEWLALLQTHHLVCDNASLDILIAEVMAYLEGRESTLPKPVPFRVHVAQAVAKAGDEEQYESFFRNKLGDLTEPTLPFGLRDIHGDGRGIELVAHPLDRDLARRVRLQARRLRMSAATLFHAAWALVASHTSGRDDVVFGSVLLGRLQSTAGGQRILGMFINTLPLRVRLQDLTARGLVEQTHRELLDLMNHEQASLSLAQRCSGVGASTPLFNSIVNYRHEIAGRSLDWSGAQGVKMLKSQGGTNYPIVLSVDDDGQGFGLELEADRSIEPRRVIGYVAEALTSLISALEKEPGSPALTLSILPEGERTRILQTFNRTSWVPREDRCIPEWFESQAQRTPDAPAVTYEGWSLSYRQLNERANQLANYLLEQGVRADQLVGICVERGLDMVVGLLGILKAGGAYVPLDPGYPAERLQYMLSDAAPKMLLTQASLQDRFANTSCSRICLDSAWPEIARYSKSNPDPKASGLQPHHLAYVIYTSGSTGQPKGAMVEHRQVTRLFTTTEAWYRFDERDVWTLFHSFAFDFSVWEIWGALFYGGRLVVVPHCTSRSPKEFYRLLCAEKVTVLNQTPSAFIQLIDAQPQVPEAHHSLRLVIFGGEALELRTLRPWVARNGATQPRLVNMYGITETTVHVTYSPLTADEIEGGRGSPIGQPIPDLQVYLLNRRLQPVPVGVVGELYVGGAGLARGYLNRPELTSERFIRNPFGMDDESRLYKTGDLGQWRSDGTLDYLGRNDHQVKIRGFRIELGEIEAQLVRHPGVKEAVVLARQDQPGEKRLVAYVIPAPETRGGIDPAELRQHLKRVLPDHMVPSAFVLLESLPLTVNGKLDRAALPAPQIDALARRRYEAPQGEVEEALARVWESVLKVEGVGRTDNFFELGGHSLNAITLIDRVGTQFGLQLSIGSLFQNPTLQEFAAIVDSLLVTRAEPAEASLIESEEGLL